MFIKKCFTHIYINKAKLIKQSGERGIRTPGPVTVNGFQDRRIRPLCHLSGAKIHVEKLSRIKIIFNFYTYLFMRNE